MDEILRKRAQVLEQYARLKAEYPALPEVLRDFQVYCAPQCLFAGCSLNTFNQSWYWESNGMAGCPMDMTSSTSIFSNPGGHHCCCTRHCWRASPVRSPPTLCPMKKTSIAVTSHRLKETLLSGISGMGIGSHTA